MPLFQLMPCSQWWLVLWSLLNFQKWKLWARMAFLWSHIIALLKVAAPASNDQWQRIQHVESSTKATEEFLSYRTSIILTRMHIVNYQGMHVVNIRDITYLTSGKGIYIRFPQIHSSLGPAHRQICFFGARTLQIAFPSSVRWRGMARRFDITMKKSWFFRSRDSMRFVKYFTTFMTKEATLANYVSRKQSRRTQKNDLILLPSRDVMSSIDYTFLASKIWIRGFLLSSVGHSSPNVTWR